MARGGWRGFGGEGASGARARGAGPQDGGCHRPHTPVLRPPPAHRDGLPPQRDGRCQVPPFLHPYIPHRRCACATAQAPHRRAKPHELSSELYSEGVRAHLSWREHGDHGGACHRAQRKVHACNVAHDVPVGGLGRRSAALGESHWRADGWLRRGWGR